MAERKELVERLIKVLGLKGDTGFVELTPSLANTLLELNTNNRAISKKVVDRYAKDIIDGRWHKDKDAISISEDGVLKNGQHRLLAVIKANKPITVLFAIGVDNHNEMDRGKQRSIADNVGLSERLAYHPIAEHKDLHKFAASFVRLINKGKADTHQVEDLLEVLGDKLIEAKEIGLLNGTGRTATASVKAAFFVAYLNGADITMLIRIKEVLKSGVGYGDKESPIIGLRDYLAGAKGGGALIEQIRYKRTLYCIEACDCDMELNDPYSGMSSDEAFELAQCMDNDLLWDLFSNEIPGISHLYIVYVASDSVIKGV